MAEEKTQTQKINGLISTNFDLNMEKDQLKMNVEHYKTKCEELKKEITQKEREMINNVSVSKFQGRKLDEEMDIDNDVSEFHSINSFWIDDFDTEFSNYNLSSIGPQKVNINFILSNQQTDRSLNSLSDNSDDMTHLYMRLPA